VIGMSTVSIELAWVYSVVLLATRLSATLAMTPLLSAVSMPGPVRVVFVLALSGVLAASLPGGGPVELPSLGTVFVQVFTELALGATMGLGVQVGFAAFSIAGRLLDVQVGYGIAQVLDPMTRTQLPLLTAIFAQASIVMFFLLDAHHLLMRGIAMGVEVFPIGSPWPLQNAVPAVMRHVAGLFALGLALVAPVVASLLLLELALAVVSRALPQANMFAVGNSIKILAGLVVLSIWATTSAATFNRIYAQIFRSWEAMFR
jgi:flagellar biosynthetic protein FliR